MTAPAEFTRTGDLAPIVVDLAAPGVYEGQLMLARFIEQAIRAMPLEGLHDRASDEHGLAVLKMDRDDADRKQDDLEIIWTLASAQCELLKIRARYGE